MKESMWPSHRMVHRYSNRPDILPSPHTLGWTTTLGKTWCGEPASFTTDMVRPYERAEMRLAIEVLQNPAGCGCEDCFCIHLQSSWVTHVVGASMRLSESGLDGDVACTYHMR
jgi:hypothetical protein